MAVLLTNSTHAVWNTYQADLQNTGRSFLSGYFPLKTSNFSRNDLGMDFKPLVDDLNLDGESDIVIFYNDSIFILDKSLRTINTTKTGAILGQPALFNYDNDSSIEIIFNAKQAGIQYFFAYELNNLKLKQEFNITLPFDANRSGIKCLHLNGTDTCVFKDKRNYVHLVDLERRIDDYYNTSTFSEIRYSVPSIADLDNDGNAEAVFWFNEDNAGGYGFLVFDLIQRRPDPVFNGKGTVDNIFSPFIIQSGIEQWENFILKGNPVLVDLNNDGKMEIAASVVYDDMSNIDSRTDWFTELFVYNHNGTKVFSTCGSNCNDAVSGSRRWHGSNPFIMDFGADGKDEVCFMLEVRSLPSFMTLSCYNYSETIVSRFVSFSDEIKSAAAADINNDGFMEVITPNDIYLQNGSSIFNYPLSNVNPVAVNIDENKGIDLLWTQEAKTVVLLDSLNYTADLSVSDKEIYFSKYNKTHISVSAIIRNFGGSEESATVSLYNSRTSEEKTQNIIVRRNSNSSSSSIIEVQENDVIALVVDPFNEINESQESNNFASREFFGIPYVYVFSSTGFADGEFRNYIKNGLISGHYTEDEINADVKVYIGKFNPFSMDLIQNLDDIKIRSAGMEFYGEYAENPYSGIVASLRDKLSGQIQVIVAGNDIDGDIAASKNFIKNQELFVNGENRALISNNNEEAIKVYDYLHTDGNNAHYKSSGEQFKVIIKNALNDNMFNQIDFNLTTSNNIVLRTRNLKANFSQDYLEYLNSNGAPVQTPVVLAHGLFSNLSTWQVLASEISNTGRDVWLIEITGGPGQDCDSCIDYTFYNLTDIFVPALLNEVLSKTQKSELQYVGFSNGCRSALDSMERGMFDSSKIETFIAVGCPGAFEGLNVGEYSIKLLDDKINHNLNNKSHIGIIDLLINGVFGYSLLDESEKISFNLWKTYNDFISKTSDSQPGNITFKKFTIIYGNIGFTSDTIVSVKDEKDIFDRINPTTSKSMFSIKATHIDLDQRQSTKNLIKKIINNQSIDYLERILYLDEEEVSE